jgi:hypothetical protein
MRAFLVIVSVCCAVAAQAAYEFSNVTLIQRWPWNQLVDVEFDVKQPTGHQSMRLGARLELTATVGGVSTVLDAATLSNTYVFGEGRKRIVWNPMPQFAGQDMKNVQLSFRTLEEDVPLGYLVVKIDDGSWWYKPLSFSNEVNTTTYKTTHLAFRYIPSTVSSTWLDMSGGTDTFRIGSDGSRATALGMNSTDVYVEKQADIRLTKGFFMGVFPLTRAQYVELGYSLYGIPTNEVPVRGLNYNILRGADTAEGYCYPTNRAVASDSLIGRLRSRTRLDFDLPTEAQWEYAYRAGSTGEFFFVESGNLQDQIREYAAFDTGRTLPVGSKKPNPWGLYDLIGCCHQWTTTSARTSTSSDLSARILHEDATDPTGSIPTYDNPYRICRGSHQGASGVMTRVCRASYRLGVRTNQDTSSGEGSYAGCRLALTLDIQ